MPDGFGRDRRIRTAGAVAAVARLAHDRSAPPVQAHRVQTSKILGIAFSTSSYELLPFVLSTRRRTPASASGGLPGAPVPLPPFMLPLDDHDDLAAAPPPAAPPAMTAPCIAVAAAIWPARMTGANTSLCPSDRLPPRTAVMIRGRCHTSKLYIKVPISTSNATSTGAVVTNGVSFTCCASVIQLPLKIMPALMTP